LNPEGETFRGILPASNGFTTGCLDWLMQPTASQGALQIALDNPDKG